MNSDLEENEDAIHSSEGSDSLDIDNILNSESDEEITPNFQVIVENLEDDLQEKFALCCIKNSMKQNHGEPKLRDNNRYLITTNPRGQAKYKKILYDKIPNLDYIQQSIHFHKNTTNDAIASTLIRISGEGVTKSCCRRVIIDWHKGIDVRILSPFLLVCELCVIVVIDECNVIIPNGCIGNCIVKIMFQEEHMKNLNVLIHDPITCIMLEPTCDDKYLKHKYCRHFTQKKGYNTVPYMQEITVKEDDNIFPIKVLDLKGSVEANTSHYIVHFKRQGKEGTHMLKLPLKIYLKCHDLLESIHEDEGTAFNWVRPILHPNKMVDFKRFKDSKEYLHTPCGSGYIETLVDIQGMTTLESASRSERKIPSLKDLCHAFLRKNGINIESIYLQKENDSLIRLNESYQLPLEVEYHMTKYDLCNGCGDPYYGGFTFEATSYCNSVYVFNMTTKPPRIPSTYIQLCWKCHLKLLRKEYLIDRILQPIITMRTIDSVIADNGKPLKYSSLEQFREIIEESLRYQYKEDIMFGYGVGNLGLF